MGDTCNKTFLRVPNLYTWNRASFVPAKTCPDPRKRGVKLYRNTVHGFYFLSNTYGLKSKMNNANFAVKQYAPGEIETKIPDCERDIAR